MNHFIDVKYVKLIFIYPKIKDNVYLLNQK